MSENLMKYLEWRARAREREAQYDLEMLRKDQEKKRLKAEKQAAMLKLDEPPTLRATDAIGHKLEELMWAYDLKPEDYAKQLRIECLWCYKIKPYKDFPSGTSSLGVKRQCRACRNESKQLARSRKPKGKRRQSGGV